MEQEEEEEKKERVAAWTGQCLECWWELSNYQVVNSSILAIDAFACIFLVVSCSHVNVFTADQPRTCSTNFDEDTSERERETQAERKYNLYGNIHMHMHIDMSIGSSIGRGWRWRWGEKRREEHHSYIHFTLALLNSQVMKSNTLFKCYWKLRR